MLGGHAIEDWMTDGWQELRMKLGGSWSSVGRLDSQLLGVMIIRQVPGGKFVFGFFVHCLRLASELILFITYGNLRPRCQPSQTRRNT